MLRFLRQTKQELHQFEQTCVEQSDKNTGNDNSTEYDTGINHNGFFGRPCDHFELTLEVSKPFADTAGFLLVFFLVFFIRLFSFGFFVFFGFFFFRNFGQSVFFFSPCAVPPLLRFFMQCMLAAELAVFVHFETVRVIFLVFLCHIVATLAFSASQCYFHSHVAAPPDRIAFIRLIRMSFSFLPPSLDRDKKST